MSAARLFLSAALCLALAIGAALAETGARKGTRNYRPDGTSATDIPDAQTSIPRDEKLQQCMETWDPGTHITKAKWREICIRQLDAR